MMDPAGDSRASEYPRPLSPSAREGEGTLRRRGERWLKMGNKFFEVVTAMFL